MMKKILFAFFLLAFSYYLSAPIIFAAPENVDVALTSYFDDENVIVRSPITKAYGSRFSFDSNVGSLEGYSFVYWIVNGTIRPDLPIDYQFMVSTNLQLVAVFTPTSKYAVLFMDTNGKILDRQYVSPEANASEPDITLPTKPGLTVATPRWETSTNITSLDNIDSHRVYVLQYEVSAATTFTLTVTGGTGGGPKNYNAVATATANPDTEGSIFSHWIENGHIISTQRSLSITMLSNRSITAVFVSTIPEKEVDSPRISITTDLELRSEKRTYTGQFYLPDGYQLVEYGFITSASPQIITLDTSNITIRQSQKYVAQTNEFLMTIPVTGNLSVRAYLVVKNSGGDISTYYSGFSNLYGSLMIYEIYGGGGTSGAPYKNDFIVLYNGTTFDISLIGYSIQYAGAIGTNWEKVNLSGTIKAGNYYLIGLSGSSGVGNSLPTPDDTGALSLSLQTGKVALRTSTIALSGIGPFNNDSSVVDFVGYGKMANGYEGVGPTPEPTGTTSVGRITFIDTNKNKIDFEVRYPVPRNSSSIYLS